MNIFSNIHIPSAELDYVIGLDPGDRVQYLFELYDIERARKNNVNLNLEEFFSNLDSDSTEDPVFEEYGDSDSDNNRVDVMIDQETILIESNSLKALRVIRNHFIESGYILFRDKETEKVFKRDKVTKYLRVFSIVNQIDPLCCN